jgi:chromosome segregation ATPase
VILKGFEIENWNCIKKVSVSGLPPTGVVVIHGPNRRGKSSIVQALRACLMDYPSSSKSEKVTSCYPRGTGARPVVSVTFQAGGTTYRIKKHFGSSKSELAMKTSTGAWRVETTSAAEAHDRTCGFVGGDDSTKGLHQLLWLTQAEFRLPDPKKLDGNVQAQLRGILGVLQSPLDDRFIERVRKRWNVWFSGQRKPDKQPTLKKNCGLAAYVAKLEAHQRELQESDGKFAEVEGLIRQSANLELGKLDLERQLSDQTNKLEVVREEHHRSQVRIEARRHAEKDHAAAVKERTEALREQEQRAQAVKRFLDVENAIEPARKNVEGLGQAVKTWEDRQTQLRIEHGMQRETRRESQNDANCIAAKLRELDDAEKLVAAQEDLKRAQRIADEIDNLQKYLSEYSSPDKETLHALKANRQRVALLEADRDAASMSLTLMPERGAGTAQLAVDGGPLQEVPNVDAPGAYAVRRKAHVLIGGWGRVEMSRGTGQTDLDQIEAKLRQCHETFASALAPFGIAANDPDALEKLIERDVEHRSKNLAVAKQRNELMRLAPRGLEPLRIRVVELQTKLKSVSSTDADDAESLPSERSELERHAALLQRQIASVDEYIARLEEDAASTQTQLDRARQAETEAKETLATCRAAAKSGREELDRLRSDEQIIQHVENANRAVRDAEARLQQTELTNDERTVDQRLAAATQAVDALHSQMVENTRKYDVIKGRLLESEGLHARRSSSAARVDELTRLTDRESLEKDAVDRLYALFEECREKQLGTLMGPIQDRVLSWMRVLDIGDYKEVRFNDAFLPDKLMSRDGTAEFTIQEESTGAQEQIGMLVRLALGSTLASANEPAVAILDDPLTHCDVGRLSKMRVILRRAAEGDRNLTPPAGQLQIIILTCHPEWFRDERATVIDLENPEVMIRSAV